MLGMNSSPPLKQSSPSRNPIVEAQTSNNNDDSDDNNQIPLDRSSSGATDSLHSKLPSESSNDYDNDGKDGEENIQIDLPSNERQNSSNPTSNNGLETQNPPVQVMERAEDPASTTSAAESTYSYSHSSSSCSSASSSRRIPSHVFAIGDKSNFQWSTLSNDSLFSIQMGNFSFTRDMSWLSKSSDLDRSFISGVGDIMVSVPSSNNLAPVPLPPKPQPQSQPQPAANRFGDISLRASEQQKGWRFTEEKAAETMREVIMEESLRNGNLSPVNRVPYPIRHCDSYSNNGSTKSFAFKPTTTDRTRSPSAMHGMEEKPNQQKKQLEQKNINIAKETQTPPPKSNIKPSQKSWFSCFACCE